MASLILTLSIISCLLIYIAKRRFTSKYTVIAQFIVGFTLLEVAWIHGLLNIAFMLMAIGDLANWHMNTVLGFALCGYNAFRLFTLHNLTMESDALFNQQLKTDYGENYLDQIKEDRRPLIKQGVSGYSWLKPFHLKRSDIETIADINYSNHPQTKLTIYRPKKPTSGKMPVMLQIPGGGWMLSHSEHQALPLRNQLVEAGWIFISIDYRLSPDARFPDHLIDCKKALHWVAENITRFGGDPEFIMVTGGSAGAHLASLLALSHEQEKNLLQPGFESVKLPRLRGCIPLYGVYDFTDSLAHRKKIPFTPFLTAKVMPGSIEEKLELWLLASPMHQIHDDVPPFFIIHGELDSLAFYEEAEAFTESLKECSQQPVTLITLPLAQHAFDLYYSPHCIASIQSAHVFAEIHYTAYLNSL